MGLHFHGHAVRRYKDQGKEELLNAQSGIDPVDKLHKDIELHILKEDAKQHATDAQRHLSHAAEHFRKALHDYKEACKLKVSGTPPVVPTPPPVPKP